MKSQFIAFVLYEVLYEDISYCLLVLGREIMYGFLMSVIHEMTTSLLCQIIRRKATVLP